MSIYRDFYKTSLNNKQSIDKGNPVIIPFSFSPKLCEAIPGLVRGDYIVVSASSGVGKSRFTRKVFIKDVLKYANQHNMPVKIFLNSLEEPEEKVAATLVGELYYRKYNTTLDYYTLMNYREESLDESTMNRVSECVEEAELLYKDLEVVQIPSATGFYHKVRDYLATVGSFMYNGQEVNVGERWNKYVPDNPNQIVIAISDTIDKYPGEHIQGKMQSQFETLKMFSSIYMRQRLGLACGVITVIVQQQVNDKEKVETTYKGKTIVEKMKPSLATLAKYKATQEDATLAFGLFDPLRAGEKVYGDIDITSLPYSFRSLIVLKTREGAVEDREIPLACNFTIDEFKQI